MRRIHFLWLASGAALALIILAGGCRAVTQVVNNPKSAQPTPTFTPAPTTTPLPRYTGSGQIDLYYLHTISGGMFKVQAEIPFTINWNEKKGVWEARSKNVMGRGLAKMSSSGLECNALFVPQIRFTSGVIVPPNPLKLLGDCKLVAAYQNKYDNFMWGCDKGISFNNEATTSDVGPITFDLRIGSRQSASGQPGEAWTSIYEYVITKLSLPSTYLAPYCDTSGVIDTMLPPTAP